MGCVYKIVDLIDSKSYIGWTKKSVLDRFAEHCKNSRHGNQCLLSQAMRRFGMENFKVFVIFVSEDEKLLDRMERFFIAYYNTNVCNDGIGYNMTSGGQGTSGFKWNLQSRLKRTKKCLVSYEELQNDANTMTQNEIAEKYHVSVSTMTRWLDEAKIIKPLVQHKVRNQSIDPWTKHDESQAVSLYFQRKNMKEIAILLNRSIPSVSLKISRLRRKQKLSRVR